MPGGFAHITLVTELRNRLDSLNHFTNADRLAVGRNLPFCEVGAVAPDYPYLDLPLKGDSPAWADRMHYEQTGEPIRAGVRWLRQQDNSPERERALAWLMGYAAHLGADLTIHPVVERRVGPYHENAKNHRICEMHQDTFIWQRRNLGNIGVADHFDNAIRVASNSDGRNLAEPIPELWLHMFTSTWPDEVASTPPDIDQWHRGYRRIIDAVEEGHQLFKAARHLLAGEGIAYPNSDELDDSFIYNLETPNGRMDYEAVFESAVSNIAGIWETIAEALHAVDEENAETALQALPDGNLDTGRDLATDEYVFWRTV